MSISFFTKNKLVEFPIGQYLTVDVHSHVLPGIDDGAADTQASIHLLNGLYQLGIEMVVGTPHVMADIHRNNRHTIFTAYEQLQQELSHRADVPQVHYAAEHMMDDGFGNLLLEKQVIPYGDSAHILVETRYLNRPLNLEHLSFQLGTAGFKPILAHPERYHYLFDQPKAYEQLKDLGFAFQLNALSLLGYYGKLEKAAALWLLEAGYIDYMGTDIHHARHLKNLQHYKLPQDTVKLLERTALRNCELAQAYMHTPVELPA